MSVEKRRDIKYAKEYLKSAENELHQAAEFAKKAGDGKTAEQIVKVKESTTKISKEIDEKLNENSKS
jgi:hypothetical protein